MNDRVSRDAAMTRRALIRGSAAAALVHGSGATALMRAGGAAALTLTAPGVRAAPAQPGERVVWPELQLLDGTRWTRADDHAVVVVFWSLTCPFCVRHNTHLTQLQARSAGQRLQVLGAVREPDAEGVRRHMARHGHRFDVTLGLPALAAALSMRRLTPLTVTVDRQGRLLQVIPGEMAADDVMDLQRLAA